MSKPYTVKEFTATTGNRCRMKIIRAGSKIGVDACWEREATRQEIDESNQFLGQYFADTYGMPTELIELPKSDNPVLRKQAMNDYLGMGNN